MPPLPIPSHLGRRNVAWILRVGTNLMTGLLPLAGAGRHVNSDGQCRPAGERAADGRFTDLHRDREFVRVLREKGQYPEACAAR